MKIIGKYIIATLVNAALLSPLPVSAEQKQEKEPAAPVAALQTTRYYLDLRQSASALHGQAQSVNITCGDQLLQQTGLTANDLARFVTSHRIGSLIEALNYLTEYGWTLQQAYTVTERGQTTIHWIVAKDTSHPMELLDGIVE